MRKAALSLAVTLALALLMALTTAVALAGWDWDDTHPGKAAKPKSDKTTVLVSKAQPSHGFAAGE